MTISVSEALSSMSFDTGGDIIPEGMLISDAVVIMRMVDSVDGSESMMLARSDGCSGIVAVGLVSQASAALNQVAQL